MGIIELFDKFVTEKGSAAILDKQVAFFRDQLVALENKVTQLEQEKSALVEQLAKCNADLESRVAAEKFEQYRGALFKRKPEGGYEVAAFCVRCHKQMSSAFDEIPFTCPCGGKTPLTPEDLPYALTQLPP